MDKKKEKNIKKTELKKVENKAETKVVSSFKKKKKVKKNISSGIAFVYSTFNNTIISIADENGNVVSWSSAGAKGFKGSRKSTPYAAQVAADDAGLRIAVAASPVIILLRRVSGPSNLAHTFRTS